jgi:hypothetical protein
MLNKKINQGANNKKDNNSNNINVNTENSNKQQSDNRIKFANIINQSHGQNQTSTLKEIKDSY